jgi:hypothetical protein
VLTVIKGVQGESWKTTLGSQGTSPKTAIMTALKKGQLTLPQGMMKKGDDVAVDEDDDDAVRTSVSQN